MGRRPGREHRPRDHRGCARDGPGTFSPAVESTVEPTQPLVDLRTFVTGDGSLLLFWTNGAAPGAVNVRYSQAAAGGAFATPRTLIGGPPARAGPAYAANAAGRAAVLFPVASGSGTSLRAILRNSSGTWGSARQVGPSGARKIGLPSVGVDGRGRVVALWGDSSSSTAPRILAARSSSSTNPLNTYNQVSQRSGDRRCDNPTLALSSSGDGLGSWALLDGLVGLDHRPAPGAPDRPVLSAGRLSAARPRSPTRSAATRAPAGPARCRGG